MYGYELTEQFKDSIEMAELNLSLLTETANDRRTDGDRRDVAEFLDQDQRDMYLRALVFLQERTTVKMPPAGSRAAT